MWNRATFVFCGSVLSFDHTVAAQFPIEILIAEDQPINMRLLVRFLEKLGYAHVTTAANGVEALNKVKKQHFNLIFMDVQVRNQMKVLPVLSWLEELTVCMRSFFFLFFFCVVKRCQSSTESQPRNT